MLVVDLIRMLKYCGCW